MSKATEFNEITKQRLLVIVRLFRRLGWAERRWVLQRLAADHAELTRAERAACGLRDR